MPELQIADDFTMPVDLVTEAIAILGKRGRGKTNTAVVMVEEMVGAGLPVVVVDTVGVWWGLRSSADGKKPGLPMVIFGGSHADVPLEESAGKVIANAIVDNALSAVIDTSLLSKAAARRFLLAFVTELYHRKSRERTPLHVVFDEADELAPQRPGPEGAPLLGAMEDFVRRGRARGLGTTLVTQRPAVLNKDVLTQVEVLVAMGMTGPRDVQAIDEWVRLHADEDEAREVKQTLAALPVGTAWVWSPEWLGVLRKVAVRPRQTFDSSATPKVGKTVAAPKARAEIDLAALGAQIAATVEKQKADDPRELRRQIADLTRELAAQAQVRVEVPVLLPEDRTAIVRLIDALGDTRSALVPAMERVLGEQLQPALQEAERPPAPVTKMPARPRPTPVEISPDRTPLGKAERTILAVLATYGPRTHVQLALLTGYSHTSGGFRNSLGKLRSSGLIVGGRDEISITDAGVGALGDFEPLPSGQALIDHWAGLLGKAERTILLALLDVYPRSLTHEELAAATEYQPTSGGFRNALGKLRTLELIYGGRDAITASETLGAEKAISA